MTVPATPLVLAPLPRPAIALHLPHLSAAPDDAPRTLLAIAGGLLVGLAAAGAAVVGRTLPRLRA